MIKLSPAACTVAFTVTGVGMSGAYFYGFSSIVGVVPVSIFSFSDYISKAVDFIPLMGLFLVLGMMFGSYLRPAMEADESESEYAARTGWTNLNKKIVHSIFIFTIIAPPAYSFFWRNWYEIYPYQISLAFLGAHFFIKFVFDSGFVSRVDDPRAMRLLMLALAMVPLLLVLAFGRGWSAGIEVIDASINGESRYFDFYELGVLSVGDSGDLLIGEFEFGKPEELRDVSMACRTISFRCPADYVRPG